MSSGPLQGVSVVDFSHVRAGPWCTQLLGELGADVVKIERPGVGAIERGGEPRQNGVSAEHLARNRHKESIAIDLKSEEGQDIVFQLVEKADVLVENFSLGTMESFGLDYDSVSEAHPGLVYASIKGYGESGPYKDRKGVDIIMQAEGGIMSVTGPMEGPPVKVGQSIADIGTGIYTALAIIAALYEREQSGEGQKVNTDLFGTIISFMEEYLTMYGMTGETPTPSGRRHQSIVPCEIVETSDGYFAFMVPGRAGMWETFVTEILDAEELLQYESLYDRQEHYEQIADVMHPVFRQHPTDHWMDRFAEYGFPHGRMNDVPDLIDHPQAKAQGYVIEHAHEQAGDVYLHGHPFHFSRSDKQPADDAPALGEHTRDVLSELGLGSDEIDTLFSEAVVE